MLRSKTSAASGPRTFANCSAYSALASVKRNSMERKSLLCSRRLGKQRAIRIAEYTISKLSASLRAHLPASHSCPCNKQRRPDNRAATDYVVPEKRDVREEECPEHDSLACKHAVKGRRTVDAAEKERQHKDPEERAIKERPQYIDRDNQRP